jgi:hypothetical protein
MKNKIKIGQKHGDWTIQSNPLILPNKTYRSILVKCKCNNEQYISVSSIIQNSSTKCLSCSKKEKNQKRDLPIETKYGEWKVTGQSFTDKRNNTLIPVICSCGYKTDINKHDLLKKDSHMSCKSCSLFKGVGDLTGAYITEIKNRAKKRGFDFSITTEYLWNLLIQQKFKCALTGLDITVNKNWRKQYFTASLDRIDSTKGYIIGNVQWVHKTINRLKSNFPEHELIYWAKLLIKQNKLGNTNKTN